MSATGMLVDAAIREARTRGLKADRVPRDYPISHRERRSVHRWILVNEQLCQVVPTRIAQVRNPKGSPYPALQWYLPRSTSPSFLVYVADSVPPGTSRFYIVPRVALRRDTFLSLQSARSYADRWDLLKHPAKRRRISQFEWLPQQTKWVIGEAKRRGCDIRLIPQKQIFRSPSDWKERLYINGHSCQVMIATRQSPSPNRPRWRYVYIRTPRGRWQPEFVIYVVWGVDRRNQPSLYVVPRVRVARDTTTSLSSWLPKYHQAWHLLADADRGAMKDS